MRRWLLVLLVITLAITLAACGGDDEKPAPPTLTFTAQPPAVPPPTPTATPLPVPEENTDPLTRSLIRVVQASPDLPAVNVYLGGAEIGRGFLPGMYHTQPLSFAAGAYRLRVVPAGENPDVATPLLSRQIELLAGQSVIIVLTGQASGLEMIQSQESLAALGQGISRLSVIHAVPRGEVFNLQENNLSLLREIDYGVTGGPVEIAEGKHTFTFASGPDTLAALDLDLIEKNAYTVVLYRGSDGGYQTLNFRSRVNDQTRARVVQMSPDLPAVDVYLGDTLLAENLALRASSEWLPFPSLPYTLRILPAGNPDAEPLVQQQVTLRPDEAISFVMFGPADRLRIEDIAEDLSPTTPDRTRYTFMLAAVGVPSVMINNIGGELPGLDPLLFGSSEPLADYPAGFTGFVFCTADDSREVDRVSERDWQPGSAYLVVIAGYPNTEAAVFGSEVGTTETVSAEQPVAAGGITFNLRLVNALPDSSPVDLAVDDQPVFDAVSPGSATSYHTFAIKPQHFVISTADGAIVLDQMIPLPDTAESVWYSLFLYRDQGDARFVLAPDADFLLGDGQARLRVFHAASGKPALHILRRIPTLDGDDTGAPAAPSAETPPTATPEPYAALVDRVEFGRPQDPSVILAGTYPLRIQEADSGTLLLDIPDVTFDELTTYDLLLLSDASGLRVTPVLLALPK